MKMNRMNQSDKSKETQQNLIQNQANMNRRRSKFLLELCENKPEIQAEKGLFDNPTFLYLTNRYLEENRLRRKELNNRTIRNEEYAKNPIKNEVEVRVLKSFDNVFDSFDEKEMQLDSEPIILITLESYFKIFWEYFMLITIIYSAFLTPYNMSFDSGVFLYEILDMAIELALILDIFLSFLTQAEDEKENIVSSSYLIMKLYIKNGFFLDLITCFPATLISVFMHNNNYLMYLRWFGLVRLLKLIKYPFITKAKLSRNQKIDRFLKNLLYTVVMINILSCFYIFLGLKSHATLNWITKKGFNPEKHFEIYISSIYFHSLLLFSIGFGGIQPTNTVEFIYTMFYLCISLFVYPYLLISASKIFNLEVAVEKIQLKIKSNVLRKLGKKHEIPEGLNKAIKKFLKKECQKQYNMRTNFFENLPLDIKLQLSTFIYKNQMKKFLFYEGQTYDFAIFTFPLLKHKIYEKRESLYVLGQSVEEMFLVVKGTVSIKLGPQFFDIDLAFIKENHYFGDIFLLTNKISPFELKIKTKEVQLFTINHQDFNLIKNKYPRNVLKIIEKSTLYLDSINQRKRHLLRLLELEKSKEMVMKSIKIINAYLFERDFEAYFMKNKEMEGVNDFLINNKFDIVKTIINEVKKRRGKLMTGPLIPNKDLHKNEIFKRILNKSNIHNTLLMNSKKYRTFFDFEHDRRTEKKIEFYELMMPTYFPRNDDKIVKLNNENINQVEETLDEEVKDVDNIDKNIHEKTKNSKIESKVDLSEKSKVLENEKAVVPEGALLKFRKKSRESKFNSIKIIQLKYKELLKLIKNISKGGKLDVKMYKQEKGFVHQINSILKKNKNNQAIMKDTLSLNIQSNGSNQNTVESTKHDKSDSSINSDSIIQSNQEISIQIIQAKKNKTNISHQESFSLNLENKIKKKISLNHNNLNIREKLFPKRISSKNRKISLDNVDNKIDVLNKKLDCILKNMKSNYSSKGNLDSES